MTKVSAKTHNGKLALVDCRALFGSKTSLMISLLITGADWERSCFHLVSLLDKEPSRQALAHPSYKSCANGSSRQTEKKVRGKRPTNFYLYVCLVASPVPSVRPRSLSSGAYIKIAAFLSISSDKTKGDLGFG